MIGALIALRLKEHHRSRMLGVIVACVAVALLLYGGARVSYYSFMRAVAQLNGTTFTTFDRSGHPCENAAFNPSLSPHSR
jgi:drug/metabolite transporter (DMT)-like permease